MNPDNSVPFGENCERISHIPNPGQVNMAKTQYLKYKVAARGAKPVFAFISRNKKRTADSFPGHPQANYEWDWGRNPQEKDGPREDHQVRLDFSGAIEYTLTLEKWEKREPPEKDRRVGDPIMKIEYRCPHTQTTVFPETIAVRLDQ